VTAIYRTGSNLQTPQATQRCTVYITESIRFTTTLVVQVKQLVRCVGVSVCPDNNL